MAVPTTTPRRSQAGKYQDLTRSQRNPAEHVPAQIIGSNQCCAEAGGLSGDDLVFSVGAIHGPNGAASRKITVMVCRSPGPAWYTGCAEYPPGSCGYGDCFC
jgi:hypothetical protein